MLLKTAWTDEDNERLKAFVADGVSLVRAAVAFKRKLNSVRNQARKLGTPVLPVGECGNSGLGRNDRRRETEDGSATLAVLSISEKVRPAQR